jgi:hypothetical protein
MERDREGGRALWFLLFVFVLPLSIDEIKPMTNSQTAQPNTVSRWQLRQLARAQYDRECQRGERNFAKDHSFEEWLER